MARLMSNRAFTGIAACGVVAALVVLLPASVAALPSYAAATGQSCGTCHVSTSGGGPFTAQGSAFAAIPTHAANPAAAWAQVSGAAAPAPAPPPVPAPAAPAPAPAAASAIAVSISGAVLDGTVVYSIMLRNSGGADVTNVFVAGSIPTGATFSGASTPPADTVFVGADQGGASWIAPIVPAMGVRGPFVYTVSKGTARDLSAFAFTHWLMPAEGSIASPMMMPISNDERLAIDQAINSKLNNIDRSLTLWDIQPGLGTVMVEYNIRFANLWFAAQARNWSMTRYQIAEMTEIQEVGETTRPNRAASLKAFEETFLDPLDDAASANDLAAFTAAYDNAIGGCNSCHAGSTGVPPDRTAPAKFIKVMRPSAAVFPNVDWAGQ